MKSQKPIKFEVPACTAPTPEGPCGRPRDISAGACWLHAALRRARRSPQSEIDELQNALQSTVPMSEAERQAEVARHHLSMIAYYARLTHDYATKATAAGATADEIAEARTGA